MNERAAVLHITIFFTDKMKQGTLSQSTETAVSLFPQNRIAIDKRKSFSY
jgi:hypothetical protein